MTTLAMIRSKVRQLTGRKSPVQLSDVEIDSQVNLYYMYEFPEQFRSFDLREEYTFTTQPNIDIYPLSPNLYQSFEPTGYVAGYPTMFVTDRTSFHKLYPDIRNDVLLAAGNGGVVYAGTISAVPLLKGSILLYGQTAFSTSVSVVDDSVGNLRDSLPSGTIRGTVNYETGAVTVAFPAVVPVGNDVRVQSRQYLANRPTTIWYWDNQITLRPVPDKCYGVRIIAYVLPTALLNGADSPILNEMWQILAYGAAMKIFENNNDSDGMAQMEQQIDKQTVLLGRRQWFQQRTQRTPSLFQSPSTNPAFYFGFTGQGF